MAGTIQTAFDRSQMARLYARRHFETDSGVRRIFYLPSQAPAREIRLLEVNALIAEMPVLEPIDFGVSIEGAEAHTLYVLDVTPAQWDAIQKQERSLPAGWTLSECQELGAR